MSQTSKSSLLARERLQSVARPAKSDRTRAAILDATLKFFWSHPFRDMTVNSLMTPTGDHRFEQVWPGFPGEFDDAAVDRIEADQAQGLTAEFDARPVAIALTRLNAYTLIEAFGQRPRKKPEPVREALARVWIATLYGSEWVGGKRFNLVRT